VIGLIWVVKAAMRFIVQQHTASTFRYDFCLEVDGFLKLWAVPRGPSTDAGERRLALQTKDYRLAFARFEKGLESDYDAGRVIVWDRGFYTPITDGSVNSALANGHLSFRLEGKRLRGGWTLQRSRVGVKPHWLLFKCQDTAAETRPDLELAAV
jgi:DNA ligase D-like protein (predicted 3'-phosphoesterase)